MFQKIKESLFGRMPKEDARETYLKINEELNSLKEGVEDGFWGVFSEFKHYENLKLKNLHKLLPSTLLGRLDNFFKRENEFKMLQEESDEQLSKLFNSHYEEEDYDNESMTAKIHRAIFKHDFRYDDFSKICFKFNEVEFKKLKEEALSNRYIENFIEYRERTEKELLQLLDDLTKAYKQDIFLPERRKTILTIVSIFLTLVLASATIITTINSNKLIEKQIELTPLLKPTIQFFPSDRNDLFIRNVDVAYPVTFRNETDKSGAKFIDTWQKERIYLIFRNIGMQPAGYITVSSPYGVFHMIEERGSSIEYLDSTSSQGLGVMIWLEGCGQDGTILTCNKSLVPLGIHVLNLTIGCQYCDEPLEEKLKICIYNETQTEEYCESLWRSN